MNLILLLSRGLPKEIASEAFFLIHPPCKWDIEEACIRGKSLLVEKWLSYGIIDPSMPDNDPIIIAAMNGYFHIVSLLLAHGADASAQNNAPLYWASKYGYSEIVRLLLAHGASVSDIDELPILGAMLSGHEEIVSILLCSMSTSGGCIGQ